MLCAGEAGKVARRQFFFEKKNGGIELIHPPPQKLFSKFPVAQATFQN